VTYMQGESQASARPAMIQAKRDRRAKLQAERSHTNKTNTLAGSPDTEPSTSGVKLSDENVDPTTKNQGQNGGSDNKKRRFWNRRRFNNRKSSGSKKQENNQTTVAVTDVANNAVQDVHIRVEHGREGTASSEGTAVENVADAKAPLVTTAEISTVSAQA
jgi:hypothetical protein